MKLSRIGIFTLLTFVLATSVGCGLVNRIRAKNALNEGARAYKDGRFAEATDKFRYAYELDPSQKNAPLFIARSIQQQYKPGVEAPENVAKGNEAIEAYQQVLANDPNNEDAYNAIVFIYRQMRNEDKEREMLMQRAGLESAPPEKRAIAYTVLASKQWNCAYEVTEQKENKETVQRPDAVIVRYKKPQNQADFDKAVTCAREGLNLVTQAIKLDPNNPNAWSYKANLLREMSKLAEMDGNAQQKTDFDKQYDEALERHKTLSEEAMKKKEAQEAAKSPTPPAS
ncbi:MAG TPA: tetratricopeptide repeat protein [Pyrinomonadaceae bacterium]|jgi:tetratricopeptide (TPR) repeat protein|nr:tetratricopeptide repeat protein [Pyrinomonadaceae bacterium]